MTEFLVVLVAALAGNVLVLWLFGDALFDLGWRLGEWWERRSDREEW